MYGQITGTIEGDNEPLIAAKVVWLETETTTFTNGKGAFSFENPENVPRASLEVEYLGYRKDTFEWKGTELSIQMQRDEHQLEGVEVTGDAPGTYRSSESVASMEVISQKELGKAACCDLSGCFETQASVKPQITNFVTEAKNLQLLGLSGVYNQVLVDGRPYLKGPAYTYGVSGYPGQWVDKIYVAKGANSVRQGYDGLAGQVNMTTFPPGGENGNLLNLYLNQFGEFQANFRTTMTFGEAEDWKLMLGLHNTQPGNIVDRDGDQFLDIPLINRNSGWLRLDYGDENDPWYASIGGRLLKEERWGGTRTFAEGIEDRNSTDAYGQREDYFQSDIFFKLQHRYGPGSGIRLDASGFRHHRDARYGVVEYGARQDFADMRLEHFMPTFEGGKLRTGVTYRYQDLGERIRLEEDPLDRQYAGFYETPLSVMGFYAEHEQAFPNEQWNWIVGARLDYDPRLDWKWVGRTQLRYRPSERHVFRASAGNGWRQVNLWSEHMPLMTGNRALVFEEPLLPEEGINAGLSYAYTFGTGDHSGSIAADYYHTYFWRQFFPDYDRTPATAYIGNYEGGTYAHAFQLEGRWSWSPEWELKAAYVMNEIQREDLQVIPLIPAHRAMVNLSYESESGWSANLNAHMIGSQRLPSTRGYPEDLTKNDRSPAYQVLSAQVNKKWNQFEIYIGCENMLDFRQKRPILSWEEPYGRYFDPIFTWGPTRGRQLYVGVNFNF